VLVPVPFLDLQPQHQLLREEILAAWTRVLDSTAFVSGAEVRAFEEEYADANGVSHCVAVSSGTDALVIALRAAGIGRGDEVVVPANTFIATAGAVSMVGAEPLLVDCLEDTATIDPAAAAVALRNGARGVLPVHLYGLPADMDPLLAAAALDQIVIEDAAQAHLAEYRGRRAGGLGTLAAFSFYPGKNLGATGEGGAVTTGDRELADQLRMLRDHGQREKYHSEVVGYNARMSELVAAALRIKLRHLPEWTAQRRRVAERYHRQLADVPSVVCQQQPEWGLSSYHLFVVRVPERDRVRAALGEAGIATGLHYPVPIHLQGAYRHLGHARGDFPHAECWAEEGLSLPMFPELTDGQIDRVCEELTRALAAIPASA
jgi:dTDP-4-amino-4,6-dideoxygalactose transaminase